MGTPSGAQDPVCLMKIDLTDNPIYRDFENRRFYFCSTACRRAFEQDPHRYMRQAA
jgi:YHS domain-containing protein